MSGNCILHVGFGHSGTTSLQENLFSKRDNLFYCGLPYHHFGGIFSAIKYADELDYKEAEIENLCDQYIWSKRNIGQRVVVSDETLTEQTTVYYTPRHMPHEIVACRLKRLFPDSTVLFTIRNQFDYIQANYFKDVLTGTYETYNGKPLLLDFGPFGPIQSATDWNTIFSVMSTPPAFFTYEGSSFKGGSNVAGEFAWVQQKVSPKRYFRPSTPFLCKATYGVENKKRAPGGALP